MGNIEVTQNPEMVKRVQEREDEIHGWWIKDMHDEFRAKGMLQDDCGRWYYPKN